MGYWKILFVTLSYFNPIIFQSNQKTWKMDDRVCWDDGLKVKIVSIPDGPKKIDIWRYDRYLIRNDRLSWLEIKVWKVWKVCKNESKMISNFHTYLSILNPIQCEHQS